MSTTTTTKPVSKTERNRRIREILENNFDSVSLHKGVYKVKSYFFYRNGRTSEKLRDRVLEVCPNSTIISHDEKWNDFPEASWWEVVFILPEDFCPEVN